MPIEWHMKQKLTRNPNVTFGTLAFSLIAATGCSDSSLSSVTSKFDSLMAKLSIESPTTSSAKSAVRISSGGNPAVVASPTVVASGTPTAVASTTPTTTTGSTITPSAASTTAPDVITSDELNAAITALQAGTNTDAVALVANFMTVNNSTYPPCYGTAWTDTATGTSVNRPSGDLGITYPQATATDTTGCLAAKLNALVAGYPQIANKLILLHSILALAAETAGTTFVEDVENDLTSSMPTFTGFTVSSAKLTYLGSTTGTDFNPETYKSAFAVSDSSSRTGTATIWFTKNNEAGTNYSLLVQADLPMQASTTSEHLGISVIATKQDGVVTYVVESGENRGTAKAAVFSSTTNRYDFTDSGFGQNGNKIIASINETTGVQTMHYAWQAGEADGASRALAVQIDATAGTGYGYFGFGDSIETLSDITTTEIWAEKMFCNWLNQLSRGSSVTNVQGQSFLYDATAAVYQASASKYLFAPTDTCQAASSYTVSTSSFTTIEGSKTITTHDLTTVTTLGTVSGVTVPTYTIP